MEKIEYIELCVESVYLGCGRGPTIGNFRLLWSKQVLKASGQNSDFRKSEPDLQLLLRKTGQNSHTVQQSSQESRLATVRSGPKISGPD